MSNYDPTKKYTWSLEDKFELSGKDFGLMLNTVRAILNTEEAIKYRLLFQTNDMLETLMASSIESGMVKEAPEPPTT